MPYDAPMLGTSLARVRRAGVTVVFTALVVLVAACSSSGSIYVATTPVPLTAGDRHIYWGDPTLDWTKSLLDPIAHTATIGGANLDGSGVSESAVVGLDSPCGVAVDAGHLYWANKNSNTIGRANLDGSGVDNDFIRGAVRPCGVAVDGSHVYWANHGYVTRGTTIGRAYLDGSGAEQDFISGALNPCGVAVDGNHAYWASEGAS